MTFPQQSVYSHQEGLVTERNAKTSGSLTIVAIVVVAAAAMGAILGLFSETLGLSGGMRGALIGTFVGALAGILMRRRMKATAQQNQP